jgi:hydroxypyruvate reductase
MKTMAEDEALAPALQGFLAKWHPECMAPRMLQEALREQFSPSRILCLGKAAPGLARAAAGLWPGVPGLAYGTSQDGEMPPGFEWLSGDHPFPTPRNLEATGAVERWVTQGEGPILACVSGGGSALLVHPRPPWTLATKVEATKTLWQKGAPIRDLNALRARLSEVKCGGLRVLAGRWPVVTAIWSDVAPRQGSYVSSGPTLVSSLSRGADEVVRRYGLSLPIPLPPCLPLPRRNAMDRAVLLCDGVVLRRACAAWLRDQGASVKEVSSAEGTPARALASRIADLAAAVGGRPCAFVGTGEVQVEAPTQAGVGGRCTHLTAEVALALARKCLHKRWTFAALATDGVDGTAGGGAWTGSGRVPSVGALAESIAAFDTASLWAREGTLVPKWPTGNNLRDLWVLAVGP